MPAKSPASPAACRPAALAIAVASGLIAGEGLTGVLAAIESIAGVPEGEGFLPAWQWLTNGFQAPIVEEG